MGNCGCVGNERNSFAAEYWFGYISSWSKEWEDELEVELDGRWKKEWEWQFEQEETYGVPTEEKSMPD